MPLLVRLRIELSADPAKQTKSERAFLMKTIDVDKYLADLEAKGRADGQREALVKTFLRVYRLRFGEPSSHVAATAEQMSDLATLESWIDLATTRPVEEVNKAVAKAKPARPVRRVKLAGTVSPRRASASR